MESFYQEMLNEIETLIQSQNIQEAIKKIEFELSMPYVPSDVEVILQQNLQELKAPTMTKKLTFDDEAIEAMLKGNEKEALIAIDYLREVNIHRYLDMIQEVFQLQTSRIVIVSLIDALMKQNITREFQCEMDGFELSFMPCFIEDPFNNDGVDAAKAFLSTWFEHDNASFYQMCIQSLMLESYLRLPFAIEEDEAEALALAICAYVYEAFGQKDEYFAFLNEKKLARIDGFELLLREHG